MLAKPYRRSSAPDVLEPEESGSDPLGLLEKLPNGSYRIGLRLWELANRTPGALSLLEVAMPYLQDVQASNQQRTQLGILKGNEVLYLERLSARQAVINFTVVGGTLPFRATFGGLVLLAHSDHRTVERVLAANFARAYHAPRPSNAQMRRLLAEVCRQGYARTDGYVHPDATAVAVPIMDYYGAAAALLAVVAPKQGLRLEGLLNTLRPAARGTAEALRGVYQGDRRKSRSGGLETTIIGMAQYV